MLVPGLLSLSLSPMLVPATDLVYKPLARWISAVLWSRERGSNARASQIVTDWPSSDEGGLERNYMIPACLLLVVLPSESQPVRHRRAGEVSFQVLFSSLPYVGLGAGPNALCYTPVDRWMDERGACASGVATLNRRAARVRRAMGTRATQPPARNCTFYYHGVSFAVLRGPGRAQ